MPRFFIDVPPAGENIIISGDDARHIGRSLRMAAGENITVCCGGRDYLCRLEKISDISVTAKIISVEDSKEPSVNLILYQALPKLDKLELIIQKAVELGASRIVPVMTKRCVSRPDSAQFEKKRERLQRISLEAAKQSGRGIRLNQANLPKNGAIGLLVGPEGGFEAYEAEEAEKNGVKKIWLGDRILRCETAPLAAISIIMNLTDNI